MFGLPIGAAIAAFLALAALDHPPHRDRYAFGEKAYLVLSLVAKSLLARQILGGSLAG